MRKVVVKAEAPSQVKVERNAPSSVSGACKRELKAEGTSVKKQENPGKVIKQDTRSDWGAALLKRGLELRQLKQEKPQGKPARRKRRATRAFREARSEVMNRSLSLSPELASYLGKTSMSRPEAIKQLWAMCRERGMLNPEDRREILFNEELTSLFGKPSARIADLHSLLAPHFRYGDAADGVNEPVAKAPKVNKQEPAAAAANAKQPAQKFENCVETVPRSKAEPGAAPVIGGCKVEMKSATPTISAMKQDVLSEQPVHAVRVRHMDRTSLSVEVVFAPQQNHLNHCLPVSCKEWVVVAIPMNQAHLESITARCISEIHETADGDFEECVEASLRGLEPGCSYKIAIVKDATPDNHDGMLPALKVPQRASPRMWSREETSWWAGCLKIPQLLQKIHEYDINGQVLFSMGMQDLKDLGFAPCLVGRILAQIDMLRTLL